MKGRLEHKHTPCQVPEPAACAEATRFRLDDPAIPARASAHGAAVPAGARDPNSPPPNGAIRGILFVGDSGKDRVMMVEGIQSALMTPSVAASGAQQPFGQGLKALGGALRTGDLDGAKAAFQALTDLRESRQGGGQGAEGRSSPMDTMMSAVGEALEAGNIEGARDAFLGERANRPPPPPPPPQQQDGANGPSPEMGDAIGSFASALQSDDSEAVESAYEALVALIEEQIAAAEEDEDAQANGALTRFREMLESLQPAIEGGNVDAARGGFSAFGPHGPLAPLNVVA
jgi:hypothetical protein